MAGERYVVLGLARARARWFSAIGQWATSASIPADFVKCVSAEELRARLRSGRSFSAALLDAGLHTVDRDLVAAVREAGAVVLIVDDGRSERDWSSLGAAAVVPVDMTRERFIDLLATHAVPISAGQARSVSDDIDLDAAIELAAPVVAVLGPGGTGSSTVAIALAQGLATPARFGSGVVLADLSLHAEQAMLHDARDVFPGLQELVDHARSGRPTPQQVLAGTHFVEQRGYHLLIGLRRAQYWTTVRPRAFEQAFGALRSSFRAVVCDVDPHLEGEAECGSLDVEERNVMARTAVTQADVVLVVGRPAMKGMHSLVRTVGEVLAAGVPAERIVAVINAAPKKPQLRSQLTRAFATLATVIAPDEALAGPIFLPSRRVDEALRDGVPVPDPLPDLLAGAFRAAWTRVRIRVAHTPSSEPELIQPGSLGLTVSAGADDHG